MGAFATVEDYRLLTGDEESPDGRVAALLAQQSAKLRVELRGADTSRMGEDCSELARLLVCDAAAKALSTPTIEGIEAVPGVSQSSFSANGFQKSVTFSNPTGAAYWDRDTLRALKRALGISQRAGTVAPSYGRLSC